MILLKSVSKSWSNFEIRNIDFSVKKGEYFVILGPTGAGKTLLLELIAGFHYPDSGQIYLEKENKNLEITYTSPEKRSIGFVYQDYMLFPHKTVFDNIAYGLKIRKFPKTEIKEKVKKMAELFKIVHILERYPSNLSGGEQQRVAIARTLVLEPNLLLLDEPLSALDPQIQLEIRDELKRIHREFGVTIVHVTHNQEEAMVLADRIAIMDHGKIIQVGGSEEIFRKPSSEFIAKFVGAENIFKGKAEKQGVITKINLGPIKISVSTDLVGDVHVTIRPEDIILSKTKIESSARNVFSGKITSIIEKESIIEMLVDVGMIFKVYITKLSFEDLDINIGSELYLIFKASAVHVF